MNKQKFGRYLKFYSLLAIYFGGSLYPPLEITRYILAYIAINGANPPGLPIPFWFEILCVWLSYTVITVVFLIMAWRTTK